MRGILVAAAPLLLAACVTQANGDAGAAPVCEVGDHGGWTAFVNAMPGPGASPILIVTGQVTVRSGGFSAGLALGPTLEMDPPVQVVHVQAVPPDGMATQALVTHELRGEYPATGDYRAVEIRCGDRLLARISPVERAH